MGKIDAFYIRLDNPNGVYFAGQPVTGRVMLVLSAPLEHRGINVKFVGEASVRWTEREGTGDDAKDVTISDAEVYFKDHITLIGDIGKTRHTLPPGEHTFPFSYNLPHGIPSSFESYYGRVFYYCKGEIDLPWKFDPKCKSPFTVNAVSDLNRTPDAANSMTKTDQKTLCCLCCRSGPLSAVVTIDRRGYVPGEAILVNAEVTNLTRSTMSNTKVVLKMLIYCKAGWRVKTDSKQLTEVKRGEVGPRQTDVWNAVQVRVPPAPPTGLVGCSLIDVHFELEFVVVTPGTSRNLVVDMPILIGSIPLQSYFSQYCPPTPLPPPAHNLQYVPTAPPFPDYPGLPPPSYKEAMYGDTFVRGEDEKEDEPFKPSYTCYKMM